MPAPEGTIIWEGMKFVPTAYRGNPNPEAEKYANKILDREAGLAMLEKLKSGVHYKILVERWTDRWNSDNFGLPDPPRDAVRIRVTMAPIRDHVLGG